MDDVLIYTKGTRTEYTDAVRLVLKALLEKGFRVKLSKCEFYTEDFDFLGFRIIPGLVAMDRKKVASVLE